MNNHYNKSFENKLFNLLQKNPVISKKIMGPFLRRDDQKTKIYCVGLPRSGTHSLAYLFNKVYRSRHEPLVGATVNYSMHVDEKSVSYTEIVNWLMMRNSFLNLEVEAAHYLYLLTPYLVNLFPESLYILTVREPKSWLISEINMNLRTSGQVLWDDYQSYKYGNYNHSYRSEFLKKSRFLYPIQSYLNYYKIHIKSVIDTVPHDRLLLVDTFSITNDIERIASFAGVKYSDLNLEKHHISKGKKKININDIISDTEITDLIEYNCNEFIEKNLPLLKKHMS